MSRISSTGCSTLFAIAIVVMITDIVAPSATIAGELRVEVASDPQVTRAEAVIEASRRFEATLLAELLRREPRLSASQLSRAWPRLWTATQAHRRERTDEQLKPYGTLYRSRVNWTLSEALVREWLNEQLNEQQQRQRAFLFAIGATILGWLAGGAMVLKLDRATRGYQRVMIVGVTCALLMMATMTGWQSVLSQ